MLMALHIFADLSLNELALIYFLVNQFCSTCLVSGSFHLVGAATIKTRMTISNFCCFKMRTLKGLNRFQLIDIHCLLCDMGTLKRLYTGLSKRALCKTFLSHPIDLMFFKNNCIVLEHICILP